MNDLPQQDPQPASASPSGNKEIVGGAGAHEFSIPKEVASSGVRITPTSIPIPAPVAQMGVTPAGKNIPPTAAPAITLPLSDDKIAEGLKQAITSSWLWLANWCVRQIKKVKRIRVHI